MKKLNAYIIHFAHLKAGNHNFDYEIDDKFLENFEQDILKNLKISVNIELKKGDALTEVNFSFEGYVTLICDRSLEEFNYPIQFNQLLFLKYGEHYEELNEELIQIPSNFQEFDISQFVFEFITLQVPLKKIHPKYNEDDDFFYSTHNIDEALKTDNIDPIWENLKKLKNNN